MGTFLPSEIARLVLGYLEDQQCMVAYNEFLNRCSHLVECRGREFFTTIMGLSLNDILDDYCAIHSYVRSMKCDEDFKKKIGRCQRLLDKLKLIFENKQLVNRRQSSVLQFLLLCLKISSEQVIQNVVNNEKCHRKVHRRNNSCDSVITIKSEKSLEGRQRTTSNDRNERCTNFSKFGHPSGDVDFEGECSPAEATNLEDLPGYGDDGSYWSDIRMMKTHRRMHLLKKNNLPTSLTPNPKLSESQRLTGAHFQSENLNKSLDRALSENKLPHHQTLEFDFRKALGLIKQPDLQHNISAKTPPKRKNVKSKMCQLSRKAPHTGDTFPNESLNVTTITNAMLDCTELHEIIADNINKIYNLSTTKPTDSAVETSRTIETTPNEIPTPKTGEDNTNMQIITIDDDLPEFENVIKSIVEKTEKEPLFDQLLNDVLAASVESTSGTESDVLSRPDTSTPEKSAPSLINDSSPASSCRSSAINPTKKLHADEQSNRRKKLSRETSQALQNVDSQIPDVDLQSTLISPILPPTPVSKTPHCDVSERDTKKYYRYPRGGKKMDVLKENYKNVNGGDKRLSVPPTTRRSAAKVDVADPDPKVIILSNERVHTNLLSEQGPIVIQKAADQILGQELNDSHNLSTETFQPNKNLIKNCESAKASIVGAPPDKQFIQLPSTSKCQGNQDVARNSTIKCYPSNLQYQPATPMGQVCDYDKSVMISMPEMVSSQQNFTTYYAGYQPSVHIQGNQNIHSANGGMIGDEGWQNPLSTYGRTVIGKPPELIISNGKVTSGYVSPVMKKTDGIYSKSDIMDMPTIILIQPNTNSTATNTYVEIPKEMQLPANYSQKSAGGKTTNEVKTRERNENVKIYPNIKSLNDIVTILDLDCFNKSKSAHTASKSESTKATKKKSTSVLPAVKTLKNVDHSANRDLNTDILSVRSNDSSEGGRFVIDEDQKRNDTESQYGNANHHDHPGPMAVVSSNAANVKAKTNDFDFLDPKRKTPDVVITKKLSFSTPRRNFSHVRVLDFNTPSTSNHVVPRKAMTSPKLPTQTPYDMNKIQQTPSASNKNMNFRSKMKNVKSCLFQHLEDAEEQGDGDKSDAISVESVEPKLSLAWDQIQGVSQIIKQKTPTQIKNKIECTQFVENLSEIKQKSRTNIKKLGAWDHNLRKMIGVENVVSTKQEKIDMAKRRCKANIAKNKKPKINLTESLKKEAKLLEEALSNKSFEASPDPPKRSENNNSNCEQPKKDSTIEQKSENSSKEILADDLEMSVNTTTEEVSPNGDNETGSNELSEGSLSNLKPVSENSHPSNDSSNSRDHLINLKYKRDAYTKTNLLKKEAMSPTKVSPPLKVIKPKSNQSKNTFKVKITKSSKSHSVEDSYDKKLEKSDHKRTENKLKSKLSRTNKSNSKCKSKGKSEVVPDVVVEMDAEPPVPSVKITPDMARGFNYNPSNAKCNLSSLLETPLKTIMLDFSLDTPKFLDKNFGEAVSALKILDIPTPNFVNSPSVSSWFNGKGHTPGSYSSRPTDYSGGSSYYKPDEIEDVNFKVAAITSVKPADQLSIISEETVDTAKEENSSTRVLRPRPANSNKSLINTIKPPVPALNTSKGKPSGNLSGEGKDKQSDSDSKWSGPDSPSSCSCTSSSSSSDTEFESPIKQAKTKTPKKKRDSDSKKHFSSTPISVNTGNRINDKQTNKCKNKENDLAHTQHDVLEEKRLRVISKLASNNKKIDKTKNTPTSRTPVSRLISKKKSFSNISPPTKLAVNPRRKRDLIKTLNKSLSPVKGSLPQKVSSKTPLKKTPMKRFLPRRAKLKTKKIEVHHDLLNSKTAVECQLSAELKSENISVPLPGIVIPAIKSRRKSSTPRKLETLMFDPDNLERQKILHAKFLAITEGSFEKPTSSLNKMHREKENVNGLLENKENNTKYDSGSLDNKKIVHTKFIQIVDSSDEIPVTNVDKISNNAEVVKDSPECNIKNLIIESDREECQKLASEKILQITDSSTNKCVPSVERCDETKNDNDLSKNNITTEINESSRDTRSDTGVSVNSQSADDEDYPSLHLSSDEAETEPTSQSMLSNHSIDDGCDNILRINEYINNPEPENPKTIFQVNLENEGFDSESAKKIEKDLTDSMIEDDESLELPVITMGKVHELSKDEDVDHPLNFDVKYSESAPENSAKNTPDSNELSASSVELEPSKEAKEKIEASKNNTVKSKSVSIDPEMKTSSSLRADSEEINSTTSNPSFNNSISVSTQPSAFESSAAPDDNDENFSPDTSSKCNEEAYVWANYECCFMKSGFIFLPFDETVKQNIPNDVPVIDIDNFTLNATIDEDDVKVITVSKHIDLFEFAPNPALNKSKEFSKSKKLLDKNERRRSLIIQCFNQSSDSSSEAFPPIKKVCDKTNLINQTGESTTVTIDNLEQDVISEMSTTGSSKSVCENSLNPKKIIGGAEINSKNKSDRDLTLVESLQESNSCRKNKPTTDKVAEKRKRSDDDDDDLEETSSKKVNAIVPQIFKKLDIESILSKIHGPK